MIRPPAPIVVLLLLAATVLPGRAADVLLAAATDAELQPVLTRMKEVKPESRAAWTWWTGTLGGRSVVLVRTEGDPLNAVAAVTLAIRRHAPKLVVTFGSARAHDPALAPGDVVASQSFAAFDGLVSQPHAPGAGVEPLTWEPLPHAVMTRGGKEHYQASFPADARALAVALALKSARGRIVAGVLGSAPQVNREADRIAWIRRTWHTSCEDAESAHVAGCALLFDLPVVGLRVIDGQPAETAALAVQFVEAWR